MLTLFDQEVDKNKNLLPYDGEVFYYGKILPFTEATSYFNSLMKNTQWQQDVVKMFGKEIVTKRKMAWYGEKEYDYTYSNVKKTSFVFTEELKQLLRIVERITGERYNSCLLNLYHNGLEGMGYHSDGEKEMKEYGAIASLSLGAERKFSFKHKETKKRIDTYLEHGSVLVMKGDTQKYWLHSLPVSKKIVEPRINLTFRSVML